jgi:acyl carrier protein
MTGEPVLPSTDALIGRLMTIWAEVLTVGVVDGNTDFIELGGTSLTAVRIRGRIRAEFGRDLDLVDILDYPTPRALAAHLPRVPVWADV